MGYIGMRGNLSRHTQYQHPAVSDFSERSPVLTGIEGLITVNNSRAVWNSVGDWAWRMARFRSSAHLRKHDGTSNSDFSKYENSLNWDRTPTGVSDAY